MQSLFHCAHGGARRLKIQLPHQFGRLFDSLCRKSSLGVQGFEAIDGCDVSGEIHGLQHKA